MTEPKRLHAILSPSGAKAWMICARKPLMEKGMPDDHNKYSDEGTCAHAVGALCLTENEPATEYVGRHFLVSGPGELPTRSYEFREDMAEPTQGYVDTVRAYHASLPGSDLYIEVKVPIDHITGETGATGTADAVIVGLDEIICIDLKFGMGEVVAKNNTQLLMYASGALAKFDQLDSVKRIRPVISQPRVSTKPSEWDCTVEELRVFEAEASTAAEFALELYTTAPKMDDHFGLQPHEDACRFCKARATCPALAEFVVDAVGADFDVVADVPDIGTITPDMGLPEIGRKFRAIPLIELFCKAVRAKAEGLLFELGNSQEAIDALGIKIVMGKQGNRAWSDKDAVEALFKGFRLRQEQMYSFTLLSPTVMQKEIAKNGKKTWWPKAEALVVRAEGKPSVADVSDKRPALVLEPGSDGFTVEEESPE